MDDVACFLAPDEHLEAQFEDRVSGEAEEPISPDPDLQQHDDSPADWRYCPMCGQQLAVASLESLHGYLAITLSETAATFDGPTEVFWDGSTTLSYHCRACHEELPESWQQCLDDLLDNRREA